MVTKELCLYRPCMREFIQIMQQKRIHITLSIYNTFTLNQILSQSSLRQAWNRSYTTNFTSYFSDAHITWKQNNTKTRKKKKRKVNNTRGQCYFSYLFIVQNIKNEINKDRKYKKKVGGMRSRNNKKKRTVKKSITKHFSQSLYFSLIWWNQCTHSLQYAFRIYCVYHNKKKSFFLLFCSQFIVLLKLNWAIAWLRRVGKKPFA